MCGLLSDLVICKFKKNMVLHDIECPHWNQVSLHNTNTNPYSCSISVFLFTHNIISYTFLYIVQPVNGYWICSYWSLSTVRAYCKYYSTFLYITSETILSARWNSIYILSLFLSVSLDVHIHIFDLGCICLWQTSTAAVCFSKTLLSAFFLWSTVASMDNTLLTRGMWKECQRFCKGPVTSFKISIDLNIFFISHEKGLGRTKMLCHSPLPHTHSISSIHITH